MKGFVAARTSSLRLRAAALLAAFVLALVTTSLGGCSDPAMDQAPAGQVAVLSLTAFPIAGSEDRVYLEGRIANGTSAVDRLLGGDTPLRPLVIAGAAGCRERVATWPDMAIAAGETVRLDRGGAFLLVEHVAPSQPLAQACPSP